MMMNKKCTAAALVALLAFSPVVAYKAYSGSCGRSYTYCGPSYVDCGPRGNYKPNPKGDAVGIGIISSMALGLSLYSYFDAQKRIEHTKKITAEFEEIHNALQQLDVYDAEYLANATFLIDVINSFNDTYQETIKHWQLCKSEHDIFSYGNLWKSEFMTSLAEWQKYNERLVATPNAPYALEDVKISLKALKKLAGEFSEGCHSVLSGAQSSKFGSKIVAGISLIGLASSLYMYGTAGAK